MTSAHAAEMVRRFKAIDQVLQTHGFPATSPWWHETIRDFYESGCRQLVVRAGRRAGKSSTLSRLAVVEGLWGGHKIPPGDAGVVAFISTTRDEASQRLRTIEAILNALGVAFRRTGDTIETDVSGHPVVFKVFPANIAGVSGFTCICAICDEVAKWRDADTGANPATEVVASLRPTLATQREARIILSSSPLGILDAHHDAFARGDDAFQLTAHAPSWIANPTLTEEDTKALEPDGGTWLREYAAVPQADAEASLLTTHELEEATRSGPVTIAKEQGHHYHAAMDPAMRADAWTLVVATTRNTSVGERRSIVFAKEWRGSRTSPLSPRAVLEEITGILKSYGVDVAWTDQAHGDSLRDIAYGLGLSLIVSPTTASSRTKMYENLKTLMAAGAIELPADAQLKADLLAVRKRITSTGMTIDLPRIGGRHADYAPAVALVMNRHFTSAPNQLYRWNKQQAEAKERRRLAVIEKQEAPWWRQRTARSWRQ